MAFVTLFWLRPASLPGIASFANRWALVWVGPSGLYGGAGPMMVKPSMTRAFWGLTYPRWFRWLYRGGWQLQWDDIVALKPRSTGQGGIVYYFVGKDQRAYLLPMRIAGFARLVRQVQAKTEIDTQDVKPLAQPWMYGILLGLTLLLGLVDLWTITTAIQLRSPVGILVPICGINFNFRFFKTS